MRTSVAVPPQAAHQGPPAEGGPAGYGPGDPAHHGAHYGQGPGEAGYGPGHDPGHPAYYGQAGEHGSGSYGPATLEGRVVREPDAFPPDTILSGAAPPSEPPQGPPPWWHESAGPPQPPPADPEPWVVADRPQRWPRQKVVLLAGGGALGLLVLLYGGALAYAGVDVPRGTTVAGIDVGGLSASEAGRKLNATLGVSGKEPMIVGLGKDTFKVDPRKAGLAVDIPATVDRAEVERSLNPVVVIGRLFASDRTVEPQVTVDDRRLKAAAGRLVGKVDRRAREGDVVFRDGEAVAVQPRDGRKLDVKGTAAGIRSGYLTKERVSLPAKISKPEVSVREVKRALEQFGQPAMSGPVTFAATIPGGGQENVTVNPEEFDEYLAMKPGESGKLRPKLDAKGLKREFEDHFGGVVREPSNAVLSASGSGVSVTSSDEPGLGIPRQALADALLDVLPSTGDRVAEFEMKKVDAELTSDNYRQLGITEVVSTFETAYPYAAYRLTNIHRAADLIEGSLVKPGDVWSLNDTVGERTAANGFAKGTIIEDGRFAEDFGGGVSQVATTTFNAVFFAGLEDVEHKPHSFYIDRYPVGREATVYWGAVDLQFRNDSGNAVYIDTSYTDSTVRVTFLGTKRYDEIRTETGEPYDRERPKTERRKGKGCVDQEPVSGFQIDVYRIFIDGGSEVGREKFHTVYNAADRIICKTA
ncbi:MAG: VanW family protein [Carbonactinosporaceae bacterium]